MINNPTKPPMTQDQMISRIREIDDSFDQTDHWSSWMVSASNEREALVDKLQAQGHNIGHKNRARTAIGGRVD